MVAKKTLDARRGCDEGVRQIRKRRCADDNQERDPMPDDGVEFVRLVANAAIVGQSDPTAPTNRFEPFFVRRGGREMIGMALDRQTAGSEDFRKALPEIAIGKIDDVHAARS